MKKLFLLCLTSVLLSGCGHTFWAGFRDNTQLASYINPLGFALNMAGEIGERITRPGSDGPENLDEKFMVKTENN